MSGREGARKLVEAICEDHGHVSQEVWDSVPQAARSVFAKALRNKDKLISSSVTTLARNLYTSNARFVFELLQNCDDNRYRKARGRGEPPHVSFRIYRDRIVMDCNEDGFDPENLHAICQVGQSSKKKGAQGYIGEKGIGFKSVFMAAYEVGIQSGDFSFRFTHYNGDPGMGMITPIWQAHDEHLDEHQTRFTLLLHQDGDAETLTRRRQTIRQQFREIHDTILLFMQKMEYIEVTFYDDDNDDKVECTTIYSIYRDPDNMVVTLTKSIYQTGKKQNIVTCYHYTKHIATNLLQNENRTYSEDEIQSKAYSKSEVVLAFPLDDDEEPVIENQWIYAFLPVRQMGFKFLIHADFVTQANREDIVTTSVRNEGLAAGIAEAFVKAVLQFCEHDTLQYQWMRYLPEEDGYPWGSFWKSVITKIRDQLHRTPCLRPEDGGPLRLARQSRQLPGNMQDSDGRPLFADIEPKRYLSLKYHGADLNLLRTHGLRLMGICEFLDRVAHDIRLTDSRLKSEISQDWRTRVAHILNLPFAKGWIQEQKRVSRLDVLSLTDGSWTSIDTSPAVYFPRVEDTELDIPGDLALKVVKPDDVANPEWKQLFDYLGVRTASVGVVSAAIAKRYQTRGFGTGIPPPVAPDIAASHLRFLYSTQHLSESRFDYSSLGFNVGNGPLQFERCRHNDFYIRDDKPYGAARLLDPVDDDEGPEGNAPGFNVLFLHSAYFRSIPPRPTADAPSWEEWLIESFPVRRYPRLMHRDEERLSDVCRYIAKHRPKYFLGYLKAAWVLEGRAAAAKAAIVEELRYTEVLCEDSSMDWLGISYLPTKTLQQLAGRFLLPHEHFPWLQLEKEPSHDTCPPEWAALGDVFGLGSDGPNVEFLFDLMQSMYDEDHEDLESPERLIELFIYLQADVRKSSKPGELVERIRVFFSKEWPGIYVPKGNYAPEYETSVHSDKCVWDSPIEMVSKHSLARLYENRFKRLFEEDHAALCAFFTQTLQVPNCTWEDLVREIQDFKSSKCTDFDRIRSLYKCLENMDLIRINADNMRKIFEEEALVCGFDGSDTVTWHKTAQCLWTSATEIRGMFTLETIYPALKRFFTHKLGVKTMTAKMVYDKLKDTELTVEEAKQTILTFNSFLVGKGREFDPAPISQKRVFPVRLPNGEVTLLKGSDDFALVDRQSLRDDFVAQANIFDFSLDETRLLREFVEWAGLTGRYLSSGVEEITSVDSHSTRPISLRSREIKHKARALLSIAVAYKSPRTRGYQEAAFYRLLRNSETLETDEITSELRLRQGDEVLRVAKATAECHIDEEDADPPRLKIYVPEDLDSQDFAFNTKLPKAFYDWMMTDSRTGQLCDNITSAAAFALAAIQSVLNSTRVEAIARVLDHHGIELLDGLTDDAEKEEEEEGPGQTVEQQLEEGAMGAAGPAGSRTPVPHSPPQLQVTRTLDRSHYGGNSSDSGGDSESDSLGSDTLPSLVPSPDTRMNSRNSGTSYPFTPSSSHPERTPSTPQGSATLLLGAPSPQGAGPSLFGSPRPQHTPGLISPEYTNLLRRTVEAARRAVVPSRGVFNMLPLQAALMGPDSGDDSDEGGDDGRAYRLPSTNKLERDKQIGAAGELFVFELLSHLSPQLPRFSRENWQSTIRSYVRAHPDYADLQHWPGQETADIVYSDLDSQLTALLVDKGYLDADLWHGARLQYYIEVKTTTGPCETPFFMSKYQYQRMQDKSNRNGQVRTTESLYIIFRIFRLGSDDVGIRVLVDPESMRRRGELTFTTATWTVVAA